MDTFLCEATYSNGNSFQMSFQYTVHRLSYILWVFQPHVCRFFLQDTSNLHILLLHLLSKQLQRQGGLRDHCFYKNGVFHCNWSHIKQDAFIRYIYSKNYLWNFCKIIFFNPIHECICCSKNAWLQVIIFWI